MCFEVPREITCSQSDCNLLWRMPGLQHSPMGFLKLSSLLVLAKRKKLTSSTVISAIPLEELNRDDCCVWNLLRRKVLHVEKRGLHTIWLLVLKMMSLSMLYTSELNKALEKPGIQVCKPPDAVCVSTKSRSISCSRSRAPISSLTVACDGNVVANLALCLQNWLIKLTFFKAPIHPYLGTW